MAISVKITSKGMQPGSTDTFYVVWKLAGIKSSQKDHLDKYTVKWKVRYTSKGAWFDGGSTDVSKGIYTATFTIPESAYEVHVWVNAYAKTHKVGKKGHQKDSPWWTCKSDSGTYVVKKIDVPSDLSSVSPSISGTYLKLTAGPIDNNEIQSGTDYVEFQVIKKKSGVNASVHFSATSKITRNFAISDNISLGAGYYYQYKARAYNSSSKKYGTWTEYSEKLYGLPDKPEITELATNTPTSVKIIFTVSGLASRYIIEYQNTNKDFNVVTETSSVEIEESSTSEGKKTKIFYIDNLQEAAIYYFRVRAENSTGLSEWSGVRTVVIGARPSPPTTWSDIYSAVLGDTVTLYWTHNSQDGSAMRKAQIRIFKNGINFMAIVVDNPYLNTRDEDKVQSYEITMSAANGFSDGDIITWDVRTKGVYENYEDYMSSFSDWSATRTITVYQKPTVSINGRFSWLWDTFNFETDRTDDESLYTSTLIYPIELSISSSPETQTPLTYHLTIIAGEEYESQDAYGNEITVAEGTEVYSGFYELSDHNFTTHLLPTDVMLENGASYIVKILVYMNSGLSAEDQKFMTASFPEETYSPQILDVIIDEEDWSAMIYPICYYADTMETLDVSDVGTLDAYDRLVFNESITMDSDDTLIFDSLGVGSKLPDVTLDLYRIEANGNYVKINDEPIANDGSVGVPDPHPALDYARYRIVVRSSYSGRISYEDYYAWTVGCSSIVIQWDDSWNPVEYMNTDTGDFVLEADDPVKSAQLILPYNIDVSESYSPDAAFVEYIGRNYPVSYYGTQRGQSASWSTQIPAEDTITLNSLRRLADWMGDVYVREPTGTGYWAHVDVSMSLKHKEVLIPVSLTVTRVEGGR